jgi:hypothetical protein
MFCRDGLRLAVIGTPVTKNRLFHQDNIVLSPIPNLVLHCSENVTIMTKLASLVCGLCMCAHSQDFRSIEASSVCTEGTSGIALKKKQGLIVESGSQYCGFSTLDHLKSQASSNQQQASDVASLRRENLDHYNTGNYPISIWGSDHSPCLMRMRSV